VITYALPPYIAVIFTSQIEQINVVTNIFEEEVGLLGLPTLKRENTGQISIPSGVLFLRSPPTLRQDPYASLEFDACPFPTVRRSSPSE